MTSDYDPVAYWTAAGSDPGHLEHESHFTRSPVYRRQEEALLDVLRTLSFSSILEAGCGFGRITGLVHRAFRQRPYRGFDLSPERVAAARRRVPEAELQVASILSYEGLSADLVLAVEVLMHVPPAELERTVARLVGLSHRYLVTLDWSQEVEGEIAPWNFRHDYLAVYDGLPMRQYQLDLQSIFVVRTDVG